MGWQEIPQPISPASLHCLHNASHWLKAPRSHLRMDVSTGAYPRGTEEGTDSLKLGFGKGILKCVEGRVLDRGIGWPEFNRIPWKGNIVKKIIKRREWALLGEECHRQWAQQVLSPEEGSCLAWGSVAGQAWVGESWEMRSELGTQLLLDSWLLFLTHGFSFVARHSTEEANCW